MDLIWAVLSAVMSRLCGYAVQGLSSQLTHAHQHASVGHADNVALHKIQIVRRHAGSAHGHSSNALFQQQSGLADGEACGISLMGRVASVAKRKSSIGIPGRKPWTPNPRHSQHPPPSGYKAGQHPGRSFLSLTIILQGTILSSIPYGRKRSPGDQHTAVPHQNTDMPIPLVDIAGLIPGIPCSLRS